MPQIYFNGPKGRINGRYAKATLITTFERIKLFYSPIPDIALRSAIIMQAIIDATKSSFF